MQKIPLRRGNKPSAGASYRKQTVWQALGRWSARMSVLAKNFLPVDSGLVMRKATDIRITGVRLYFLPLTTRVPLKFGTETVTSVTCARACISVADGKGRTA